MLKAELVKEIQEEVSFEITRGEISEVLSALETVVKNVVLKEDKVVIPGICTVKSKVVPEKTGTVLRGDNAGSKWVKPEHKEATVKIVPSLKKIFE